MLIDMLPARRADWIALLCLLPCACKAPSAVSQEPEPSPPAAHPLVARAVGVERILSLSHPSCVGHFGVDVVRMPRRDAGLDEVRDDWLFCMAGSHGVYAALLDDEWRLRADAFWEKQGLSLPWSDIKAVRLRRPDGSERAYVYSVSRGAPVIEIADVTDFPAVTTARLPIDIGLPVKIHGAHTLQIHQERGILVLNGIHVEADPMPEPLSYAAAPAQFYDIAADPMQPRPLALFVGPDAGDQVLFDSQFLRVEGEDLWAPTIAQPLKNSQSYFAFYEFDDPARMATARRRALYAGPSSGSFHNVVQLLPTPDGKPRLAAGFEAWAYGARSGQILSKAAVLDAGALLAGEGDDETHAPRHVAWLVDDHNRRHSVHNPASRMLEHKSHTYDSVPLAHFTGGYYVFECKDGQDSVRMQAHAPTAGLEPGEGLGPEHPRMNVPSWLRTYDGAWDVVTCPIGDLVSSTEQGESFLIEPSFGFVRQFGTYWPTANGAPPRIHVATGTPERGQRIRFVVSGVPEGCAVRFCATTRLLPTPQPQDGLGMVQLDLATRLSSQDGLATNGEAAFEITAPSEAAAIFAQAYVLDLTTAKASSKSPTAAVRLRPARK